MGELDIRPLLRLLRDETEPDPMEERVAAAFGE